MWSHTLIKKSHAFLLSKQQKIKDTEREVKDRLSLMNDLIKMKTANWKLVLKALQLYYINNSKELTRELSALAVIKKNRRTVIM